MSEKIVEKNGTAVDGQSKVVAEDCGDDLKQVVNDELTRIGAGGPWVWKLFFICVLPNILNGFHVSSYLFLGQMPHDYWCVIPELSASNWTTDQIRNISSQRHGFDNCKVADLNYKQLAQYSFEEAYSMDLPTPVSEVSCHNRPQSYFDYEPKEKITIVQEWDLVCENSFWRTTVQVGVSVGKFVGATTFGILSDKYGRRISFFFGTLLYLIGSIVTTCSPWYWLFLAGRVCLGVSASGLFYGAFAMLTENIGVNHRSWMSIAFSMSYPVGMLALALAAYLIAEWRYLQLALSIPALSLFVFCYFMKESPRWLLSKGRDKEAYAVVFRKKYDEEISMKQRLTPNALSEKLDEKPLTFGEKFKNSMKEVRALYGPPKIRRMALICHFTWCVTSLSYYITALNADNLSANRYIYVAATGLVDLPSYCVCVLLLKFMGRKIAIFSLFVLSGVCLLVVLLIPREEVNWVVVAAMCGRFGISAVYAIVTLHTAEMFPTEIRNSALGTSSTMAHVGSISAPYIVDFLGTISWFIPTTICGVTVLIAGALTLTQPETRSGEMSDHVKDEK